MAKKIDIPRVSTLTTGRVWLPARSVHPVSGEEDLSALTGAGAFIKDGSTPTGPDYISGTYAGTATIKGLSYHLWEVIHPAFTDDGRYVIWLKLTGGTDVPEEPVGYLDVVDEVA